MSSQNRVSTLLKSQLPSFIREDHPTFVEFLQKYLEFLETPGGPIYEFKRFSDSYDVDEARASLLKYFKDKILPSFPETTALSTERIIKAARDFYAKKGSPDSFKFLFRVLYDVDLEVSFPKLQVLKASDGKWVLPQAFRLSLSTANQSLDLNLIEKRRGVGSSSKASCVIESAIRSIDKDSGAEIIEIYVSNVNRLFENGENLEVVYTDTNDVQQTFSEKIIGALSNIRINPTRRGSKYLTGDPVIISGGLDDDSTTKRKAVATVGNVTTGSIDSVSVIKGGYGFRPFQNSLIDIVTANGVGANIIVATVNTTLNIEFSYSKDAIFYQKDLLLNAKDYDFDNAIARSLTTSAPGNTTTTVNLASLSGVSSTNDFYKNYRLEITAGTGSGASPNNAIITGYVGSTKLATVSPALGATVDGTSTVTLTGNANLTLSQAFTFEKINVAPIKALTVVNGGSSFTEEPTFEVYPLYESNYFQTTQFISVPPGSFSSYSNIANTINFVGGSFSAEDDFYVGFRLHLEKQFRRITNYVGATKTATLDRAFENNITSTNILTKTLKLDSRPLIGDMGRIAVVNVLNGGTGYSGGDTVNFHGTGYGAVGSLTVSGGVITAVTLSNRGEGYTAPPSVTITTSGGAGATFEVILIGNGEEIDVVTGDIGQIRDIVLSDRGSDYVTTPNVSLKVYDLYIDGIGGTESILENEIVYQGANVNSTTFIATVDEFYPANNILRVFDYSGTPTITTLTIYKPGELANVNTNVVSTTVSGKSYPYRYGNGRARANAEFLNGLIKYNGYYLNTDGQLSSDKRLQDDDKYHNFSYGLITEASYSDYSKTVLSTLHPSGTKLVPYHVIKTDLIVPQRSNSNVHLLIPAANVSIDNCNVDFDSTTVTGINEAFDTLANTNNLIVINTDNVYRRFAKVITQVTNQNSLTIESPCVIVGEGRGNVTSGVSTLTIRGNTNAINRFISTDDKLKINVNNVVLWKTILGITGNVITLNSSVGIVTTNANLTYLVYPKLNTVAYSIIQTER